MANQQQQQSLGKNRLLSSAPYPSHVLFRLGKLRFGNHGLLGVFALTTTGAAWWLCSHTDTNTASLPYMVLLIASQVACVATSHHSIALLPQVPPYTQIIPGVTAPHREAFVRTVSMMNYLTARVVLGSLLAPTQVTAAVCAVLGIETSTGTTSSSTSMLQLQAGCSSSYPYLCWAVLGYLWWPLVPAVPGDFRNGNTWIFVVPMFVGVTGDFWQYIFRGDVIAVQQLLQTQVLGLVLAFGFTLGFRKYISMPTVYAGAALGVWKILLTTMATIQANTVSTSAAA